MINLQVSIYRINLPFHFHIFTRSTKSPKYDHGWKPTIYVKKCRKDLSDGYDYDWARAQEAYLRMIFNLRFGKALDDDHGSLERRVEQIRSEVTYNYRRTTDIVKIK